jgi:NADH-quinone oxidoreductase subunit G
VVELTPNPGALGGFATTLVYRPGEAAAVVRALVEDGDRPDWVEAEAWRAAQDALAQAGGDGQGLVVILGRPSLAERAELAAEATAVLTGARPRAAFLPALRRGNVIGAIDMGLAPGLLPGRVDLDEGRSWFETAWGSVPAERGRDALGMLGALADGSMEALVLVGADPLGDCPDRTLAQDALERATFVVAVDTFLSPSAARADVVLPVAMAHERSGTTTNIEGRVTRVAQKLVPPGQCWPDWMVAAELAARLGEDLGVNSVAELWDEIERVAPAHAGLTRAVLDAPGGRDGVVVPLPETPVRIASRRSEALFDPMATPGIESVETQGAPPRAGLAEPLGSHDQIAVSGNGSRGTRPVGSEPRSRPPLLRWRLPLGSPEVPALDAATLRMVAPRRLYDGGVLVGSCDSLGPLAGPAVVRVHPSELERLGVAPGQPVRVRSGRGSLELEAVADDRLPRAVVSVGFNPGATDGATGPGGARPGDRLTSGAAVLIDAREPVVDVRLEGVS